MDEAAQGIATAALTLQSVLLQALVHKGVLSREDALGIVDRSLEAAGRPRAPRKPARWLRSRKAALRECARGWRRWGASIQAGPS